MLPKTLHQPFELYVADLECWHERPLIYHYFEIVQVLEGTGVRITNDNNYPYKKGSIFLFTPTDCRGFDVFETTRFCSIRFSEVFLGKSKTQQEREKIALWLKQLEHIFSHYNRVRDVIIQQPSDCVIISSMIQTMISEYDDKRPYFEDNLQYLITMVLNILVRNIDESIDPQALSHSDGLINRMLIHIGQNIADPEMLRIDHLASIFSLSSTYVSEYFKKKTGESLQHYISQYKMKMVKQRLEYSTLSISQIAVELGFTDESHLSRQFRKHNDISPSDYRKQTSNSPAIH